MRSTSLLGLIFLLSQYAIASSDSDSTCFENPDLVLVHNSGGLYECKRKDVPHALVKGTVSDAKYEDMFLFVACRGGEWWGFKTKKTKDPEKMEKLVNCLPYCEMIGNGLLKVPREGQNPVIGATCEDPSLELYFDGRKIYGNVAECSLAGGWSEKNRYRQFTYHDSPAKPQTFECRKAPIPCTYHPTEGFHFNNNILTCISGEKTLKAIKYNSNHQVSRYQSLKCGRMHHWNIWKANVKEDFEKSGKFAAEASPTLSVSCEEYCTATGEGIIVNRNGDTIEVTCQDSTLGLVYDNRRMANSMAQCSFDGWKTGSGEFREETLSPQEFFCHKPCTFHQADSIPYDSATQTFSCKSLVTSDSPVWNIEIHGILYDSLKCDSTNGWHGTKNDRYGKIGDAYVPLDATCTNFCSYSGEGTKFKRTSDGIEVYCADTDSGLTVKSEKRYPSLRCNGNFSYQWTTTNSIDVIDLDAKKMADFTCKKYHSCVMPSVEGFDYNSDEKILRCKGDGLNLFEYSSSRFYYFLCDKFNGWSGKTKSLLINMRLISGKLDFTPSKAKCIKYCEATGTGLKIEQVKGSSDGYTYPSVHVSCETREELFFDGKRIEDDKASCTVESGWNIKYYPSFKLSSTKPMQFECRARTTTTTTTTTAGPEETDAPLDNPEDRKIILIVSVVGGIIAVIIITLVIIAVCLLMRKRPENNGTMINNETNRSERMNPRYNDDSKSARSDRQL